MRRTLGLVLVGLGALLLVIAPLLKWYVTPRAEVTPLACTGTTLCDHGVSLSPSSGTATTLFDAGALKSVSNVSLVSESRYRTDVPASTGANNRTVFEVFQTVNANPTDQVSEPTGLVDASQARYAFDGHTSQMINCCNANLSGTAITNFTGIVPFKFPFNVEKKSYPYFDSTLGKPVQIDYKGTETLQGLTVYKFSQTIQPTQYATLEVPGALVGQPDLPSVEAPRFYSNERTVYVEPKTGSIVNGSEHQVQTLRGADGTDQLTLLDATLSFTPENVKGSVDAAKSGASKLNLIGTTLPLVSLLLGLVLLGLGLYLVLARPQSAAHAGPSTPTGGPEPTMSQPTNLTTLLDGGQPPGPPAS